jgi:hypothetical protein
MDLAFEILLPEETELPFRFETPKFERDGVKYPQARPEYVYTSHYKLFKTPVAAHLLLKLPIAYQKINWFCVGIYGDGLDYYRNNLLEIGPEYNDDKLNKLLNDLLTITTKWAVVFEPYYDSSWEVNSGTIESVMEEIKRAVAFERKGFIVYGES